MKMTKKKTQKLEEGLELGILLWQRKSPSEYVLHL